MPKSYQMELRHFQYFLAVAEELHFRKAADRLFISQPGLSRQIRQLEEELGVRLFERNNKRVLLTSAGKFLQDEMTLVLKNLENIKEHVRLIDKGIEGRIRIGYVGSAMQAFLPKLLKQFTIQYPAIKFALTQLDNLQQIDQLLSHSIDIGFVRVNQVPKDLHIQPVKEETFSLVLPADHPVEVADFKNLNQFKEEPFILFEKTYSPTYYERVMSIFEESGFSPYVTHTSVHAVTIFRLVENHFGLSIVPTSLKLGYDLKVKYFELTQLPQRAVLFMTWNKNNRNPILNRMLDMISL